MDKLTHSHDVTVRWRSYELRPAGAPPISEEYKAKILAARPRFAQVAFEQYGLEINNGPFGINSRPALAGAKYAESLGVGPAYHAGVLNAYWAEARDIGDSAELSTIAVAAGLEEAAFLDALNQPQWDALVTKDVEAAFQYGISGVPGLVFANKYLVSGAQPYDVLVNVVEQVQTKLN